MNRKTGARSDMILSPSTYFPPTTTASSLSLSKPSLFFRVSPSFLSFLHSSSYFPSYSSSSPSPPSSFALSLRSSARRSSTCPCVLSSPPVNAMPGLVKVKEAVEPLLATSKEDDRDKESHARTFLHAKTGEGLLSAIRKEAEAGRLPSNIAAGMEKLYQNYSNAVLQSGIPAANEVVLSNMAVVFERVYLDVEDPFVFSPRHKALREPFDYYTFGQNYIHPLIDFKNSYVGNINLFDELEEKLKQGHNVVLFSNHQTEPDPAIIALLLERTHPYIAENLIYVAGDRVLTDPLCKPFSIGRNLICVYSKKHMFDVPELIEMKKKANIRSLKELGSLFRAGSQIVWIAPSGGRDRPDPLTGEWYPALFDASSIDNMRRLSQHSDAPRHAYPLALLCHDIMPPPPQVEKEIGEKRVISFSGAGLSVAPEISFDEIAAACEKPEEASHLNLQQAKEEYTRALHSSVTEQYDVLKSAIHFKQGLEASIPTVSLSQPWN